MNKKKFLLLLSAAFLIFGNSESFSETNSKLDSQDSVDVELIYDNGIPNIQINFARTTGNRMATRFTPPDFPAKIVSAKFYVADTTAGSKLQISAMYGTDNLPSGNIFGPEEYQINSIGWNEIDFSGKNILIDEDFFIALWKSGNHEPEIGAEDKSPLSYRAYDADA